MYWVQWLVKKAMETRELFSDHYKSVASLQYDKYFHAASSFDRKIPSAVEIKKNIQQALLPQRKFKKISKNIISSENQQVKEFLKQV